MVVILFDVLYLGRKIEKMARMGLPFEGKVEV